MPLLLLLFLLSSLLTNAQSKEKNFTCVQGAIVRGDTTRKELAIVFTADEYGEGLSSIRKTMKKEGVKGSFFFTGRFYRDNKFKGEIRRLLNEGHYLGPHSNQHLLYCDWNKRDSLLVTRDSFENDVVNNIGAMMKIGLPILTPHYFIPPFEWWNDSIASWSKAQALLLFNFTPGIRTNADYTWPELGAQYKSSEWIMNWLNETMTTNVQKLNGAIVLIHAGTDPRRKDKLYSRLKEILQNFKKKGFEVKRIDELIGIR